MKALIKALPVLAAGFLAANLNAQTVANGPYYATPSWGQKLQCDTLSTCPRFVVLANWNSEAVLDRETGLVWERQPSATTNFYELSSLRCLGLKKGGRKGWRLPALAELTSLVDAAPVTASLPSGHPFALTSPGYYWSSTASYPVTTSNPIFWGVTFTDGSVATLSTSFPGYTWCVRGGAGTDFQ